MSKRTPITINLTDTSKQPTNSFTIDAGSYNYDYAVPLFGEGARDYGDLQAQTILNILERFASSTPPSNVNEGLLWFDINCNELKVAYEETPYIPEVPANPPLQQVPIPAQPATYGWRAVGSPIISVTQPTGIESLWYDETLGELKILNQDTLEWELLGHNYMALRGTLDLATDSMRGDLTITAATALQVDTLTQVFNEGDFIGDITVTNKMTLDSVAALGGAPTFWKGITSSVDNNSFVALHYPANSILGGSTKMMDTALIQSGESVAFLLDSNNTTTSAEFVIRDKTTAFFTVRETETEITNVDNIHFGGSYVQDLAAPSLTHHAATKQVHDTVAAEHLNSIERAGDEMDAGQQLIVQTTSPQITVTDNRSSDGSNTYLGPSVGFERLSGTDRHVRLRAESFNTIGFERSDTSGIWPASEVIGAESIMTLFTNGTTTHNISLHPSGTRIANVKTPTSNTDAANNTYLDSQKTSLEALINTEIENGIKGYAKVDNATGTLEASYNTSVMKVSTGVYRIYANANALFADPIQYTAVIPQMGSIVSSLAARNTTASVSSSWNDSTLLVLNVDTKHVRVDATTNYVEVRIQRTRNDIGIYQIGDFVTIQEMVPSNVDHGRTEVILYW